MPEPTNVNVKNILQDIDSIISENTKSSMAKEDMNDKAKQLLSPQPPQQTNWYEQKKQ